MEEFLKDDEFAQFIINDFLADFEMNIEEKLATICSSMGSIQYGNELF